MKKTKLCRSFKDVGNKIIPFLLEPFKYSSGIILEKWLLLRPQQGPIACVCENLTCLSDGKSKDFIPLINKTHTID